MKATELKSLINPLINYNVATDPHGVIQLQGSDLIIDIHCDCGHVSHLEGNNIYFLKCPSCKTLYELNSYVQLIKRNDITEAQAFEVKDPEL
ncbi:hypothetical protein [Rubrolithibacter danxiaensis]|uniref:hypothetical protein n=1 Tax=Rubrolithibacter danxiaensis TaxID=3390805 RepID=UPI003BF7A314